jgi:hypothetical protein
MPCHDPRDNVSVVYAKGYDPHYQQEAERLGKRCAELTSLLCQAGRARHNKTNIPQPVIEWWDRHCKLDKSKGQPW